MLSRSDIDIIEQCVDDKYFDKEKLIKYLNMHSIVGNEIFSYCDKKVGRNGSISYSSWLDDKYGYKPLPVAKFIRRIPFYFYVNDYSNNRVGNLHCLISGIIRDDKDEKTLRSYTKHLNTCYMRKIFH